MEAIILSGGLGTRLSPVLKNLPKPMAPVSGRPFLDYILSWIACYRVSKIVFAAGYMSDKIESFFGSSYEGIPVEYSIENEPLGTGGGILKATEKIGDNDFLVINGDTYFPLDLVEFSKGHMAMGGKITIALKEMCNFSRYGAVELDGENNITGFNEKEFRTKGLINGGAYFINKKFIMGLELPEKFSFERDLLEKHTGSNLKGQVFNCPFLDIGIPEDYLRAHVVL